MIILLHIHGLRGGSYISPNDLIVFAKKALDIADGDLETIKAANEILEEKPSSKDRMKILYENLVSAIEFNDLTDSMEICHECAGIPEVGACTYCKLD